MKNQNEYLKQLGVERWRLRAAVESLPEKSSFSQSLTIDELTFEALEKRVADCTACALCKTRTQTVFGSGDKKARLMFIGEGPGAEEDRQGKPFVGRAGQLLTQMIKALGINREAAFIANVVKCRPPRNRDPLPEEVEQCTPYLHRQIKLIQPALLIALGRVSAHFLLKTTTSLGKLRGQFFEYYQIPLIVTYHPAYLLRMPQDKAKALEDLKQVHAYIA